MKVPFYQIDTFSDEIFKGNPAGVCPLDEWLAPEIMQQIASENNLPATAFFVKKSDKEFEIRWFSVNREIPLCGHATLAASYVVFNYTECFEKEIIFKAEIGELKVYKTGKSITLDFPIRKTTIIENEKVAACFDQAYQSLHWSVNNFIAVFENEDQIKNAKPNFEKIKTLDSYGIAITAPGKQSDFVARYFAPNVGVDEDPVTGSVHTSLFPFWADRLKKKELSSIQLSKRGGRLKATLFDDRIHIKGTAVKYLDGALQIPKRNTNEAIISTDKTKLDIDMIHDFLKNSYWSQNRPKEIVEKTIDNSFCFGVFSDGQQVGFARVVTDFALFAYLADVFILEAYRGKGFSKKLLSEITSHPKLKSVSRWILATRDAQGLYQQFDFKPVDPKIYMKLSRPKLY